MRWAIFATVLLLFRYQHVRYSAEMEASRRAFDLPLAAVAPWFPQATSFSGLVMGHGGRDVLDANGSRLGFVVQTAPASDPVIGFSGSTNLLVGFDLQERVVGVQILASGDTPEHVRQVERDPRFLKSLIGRTWKQAADLSDVDAVSGATLTSLALVEGLSRRVGGNPLRLKFPQDVAVSDVKNLYPAAAQVQPDPGDSTIVRVYDPSGEMLGWCLRTSPAADSIVGYQGPTDTLIGFGRDGRVIGVAVLRSFDNEPYVRYVRDDAYFGEWFDGKTMAELGGLNLREAGMEGVSGATMTSQAVAEGIVSAARTAQRARAERTASHINRSAWWNWRDLGTTLVIGVGWVVGTTRLRGIAWVRVPFQILLVVYLGLVNGDLMSQAMLVGWAQHGIAIRNALGLTLLTAAALLAPAISKHNLYCHHWCPHGAAQQLLKGRLGRRWHVPQRWAAMLRLIPGLLLVWVVLVAMRHLPFSLVQIEPFDAYVVRVAGGATLAVAIVGLVASLFVPMAYCRFGCPTGALLEYLRFHQRSHEFTRRDVVACLCLALAVVCLL